MRLVLSRRQIPAHLLRFFKPIGHKTKDLVNTPSMLAEALREDGWYLRSDIAWCKAAPMPESVRDRPTTAWEHIWLLSKQPKYFYDPDAVRTGIAASTQERWQLDADGVSAYEWHHNTPASAHGIDHLTGNMRDRRYVLNPAGANLRNYWVLPPEPSGLQHYAAYPSEIPRRAILAGTSARGCCPACGAPWRRVVERERWNERDERRGTAQGWVPMPGRHTEGGQQRIHNSNGQTSGVAAATITWQPTCSCDAGAPVPCTVLDPFCGSGTTGLVARRHGRRFVGVELNPEYAQMARDRVAQDAPLFEAEPPAAVPLSPQPPLFAAAP